VNSLLPAEIKDLENLKSTLARCPHCGNIEGFVILTDRPPSSPDETNHLGLWTLMKERKRFWLLPITIVVLFLITLALSSHEVQEVVEPSVNICCVRAH
jgi:hypothetical protein